MLGFYRSHFQVAPVYFNTFVFNGLVLHTFLFYGHWKFILQSSDSLKVFVLVCVYMCTCVHMHNRLFFCNYFSMIYIYPQQCYCYEINQGKWACLVWERKVESNCIFHLSNGWFWKIQCQTLLKYVQQENRKQSAQLSKRKILIGH